MSKVGETRIYHLYTLHIFVTIFVVNYLKNIEIYNFNILKHIGDRSFYLFKSYVFILHWSFFYSYIRFNL